MNTSPTLWTEHLFGFFICVDSMNLKKGLDNRPVLCYNGSDGLFKVNLG